MDLSSNQFGLVSQRSGPEHLWRGRESIYGGPKLASGSDPRTKQLQGQYQGARILADTKTNKPYVAVQQGGYEVRHYGDNQAKVVDSRRGAEMDSFRVFHSKYGSQAQPARLRHELDSWVKDYRESAS